MMLGAIIGDIAGSRFEWKNIKSKNFQLFSPTCRLTDDSMMTLAVAAAILDSDGDASRLGTAAVRWMQKIGRRYPDAGYGGSFRRWLASEDPKPYHSFGNGASMRVSPCGFAAHTAEEAKQLARAVTEVTHNHPEGLKAAEAVAVTVFLARKGMRMPELRQYVTENYYPIDFTLNEIRPTYSFDVTCQGSVPQAFAAFFESESFEDAVRNAISIGGDSDTIAAIAGGLAEAYYGVPAELKKRAMGYFRDESLTEICSRFYDVFQPASE